MTKKQLLWVAAAGLVGGAALLWMSPDPPQDPEAQVRAAIQSMEEAAEARDLPGLMEGVSERFRGQGGVSRDQLKGMLFMTLRRGSWNQVALTDTRVVLEGVEAAEVSATALLAQGSGIASARADAYRFSLRFEREGEEWRLVHATWTPRR